MLTSIILYYFYTVKRLLVFFILLVFITTNVSFGSVFRFQVLMHHYFEHIATENIQFIDFLAIHYEKKIKHADDHHRDHEKLPFKSLLVSPIQVVLDQIQAEFFLINRLYLCIEIKQHMLFKRSCLNIYQDGIWQPPRCM